jgi:hypothetical protein
MNPIQKFFKLKNQKNFNNLSQEDKIFLYKVCLFSSKNNLGNYQLSRGILNKYYNSYGDDGYAPFAGYPDQKYIEHGIGYNFKKFNSILASGFIYSPGAARQLIPGFIQSHVNTTGSDALISCSIPQTETSSIYSSRGITFIIDADTLPADSLYGKDTVAGQMNGEVYVAGQISLRESVYAIYVANKDAPMSQINLCDLAYGSAPIEERLKVLDNIPSPELAPQIEELKQKVLQLANREGSINAQIQNKAKEKLATGELNIHNVQGWIQRIKHKNFILPFEQLSIECSNLFLYEIAKTFNIDIETLRNITIGEFVKNLLDYYSLNIPISDQLPPQNQ